MAENEYREGGDEAEVPSGLVDGDGNNVTSAPEPEEEGKKETPPDGREPAECAVLLVRTASGEIEMVTELPGIPARRKASYRDVRDMCQAAASDIMVTQIATAAASGTTRSMQQAMQAAQVGQMKKKLAGIR